MAIENRWMPAEPLSVDQPGGREPVLAVVSKVPHLVWTQGDVLYHAWREKSRWSPPVEIVMGSQPSLVSAPDGHLHLLFANVFAGNDEIYYATWSGEWSLPINVSHTSGRSHHPALALGPQGTLHAAWADTTPGYSVIYYGAYDGQFWSSEPIPNGRGANPSLAIAPDGAPYVAWQDRTDDNAPYDIFCARRLAGAWSLPENVSDSPRNNSIAPDLAIDNHSGVTCVWQEESGSNYQVYSCLRVPAGWTAPANLSMDPSDCLAPRVALAPRGLIELAWLAGGAIHHRSRLPRPDAGWQQADFTGMEGWAALSDLSNAVGEDGQVHVAWTALKPGGRWQIYYAGHEPALQHQVFLPQIGQQF